MFQFKTTKQMNINLMESQYKQISSAANIKAKLEKNEAIGFDILLDDLVVGFAMLRKYDDGCYFLWNYAIDHQFQNKHYGTIALKELIEYFKANYDLKEMSTTYIYGNEIAAHVYETVGFRVTDIVKEDDIHEVNMVLEVN